MTKISNENQFIIISFSNDYKDINNVKFLTANAAAGVNPPPVGLPPDNVDVGCGTPWGGNIGKGGGVMVVISAIGAMTGAFSSTNSAISSNPSVSKTKREK